MTGQDEARRIEAAVAEAAAKVEGVAYLRSSLSGLLRARTTRLVRGSAAPEPAPGVRARRRGTGWEVEISLTTLRGHRALDVTRAVRDAAVRAAGMVLPRPEGERVTAAGPPEGLGQEGTGATEGPAPGCSVTVTVTVTGVI